MERGEDRPWVPRGTLEAWVPLPLYRWDPRPGRRSCCPFPRSWNPVLWPPQHGCASVSLGRICVGAHLWPLRAPPVLCSPVLPAPGTSLALGCCW